MKTTVLSFKYGTSRGQNTYGYNIVSLYADGKKVASTCGGGYDMHGQVLGTWIKQNYREELKKLKGNTGSMDDGTGYYGLTFYETVKEGNGLKNLKEYKEGAVISLNGSCGENAMIRILEACGASVEYKNIGKNNYCYIVSTK